MLRHRVYAGNVGDSTITKDLVERLSTRDDCAATVWVADAGMMGAAQMAALDGAGWDRVTAEPLRKSALGLKLFKALEGQCRKDPEREHIGYKMVDVPAAESPSGRAERWVFTRNERERERQLEMIERHLDTVAEELGRKPKANQAHAAGRPRRARIPARVGRASRRRGHQQAPEAPPAFAPVLPPGRAPHPGTRHAHGARRELRALPGAEDRPDVGEAALAGRPGHGDAYRAGSKRYWQRSEPHPEFEKVMKALGQEVPAIVWSEWIEPGQKPKKRKASAS